MVIAAILAVAIAVGVFFLNADGTSTGPPTVVAPAVPPAAQQQPKYPPPPTVSDPEKRAIEGLNLRKP